MSIIVATAPGPFEAGHLPEGWHWWGIHRDGARAYLRAQKVGTFIPAGFKVMDPQEVHLRPLLHAWTAPLPLSRLDAEAAATVVPKAEDYVVVVREIPEGGRWLVGLGVGPAGASRNLRGSYPSPEAAAEFGIREARRRYAAEVEIIREHIRGGSLEWGTPFPTTLVPVVLSPKVGETSLCAYQRLQIQEGAK